MTLRVRANALNRFAIVARCGPLSALSPWERSWVAGEAPCLEDRGVYNLIKTGVAYDNRGYHPAASAYNRRYECAQALCGHAERPHPQLQAVRGVSEAISRDGDVRGYPPVPAAFGRDRREHLYPQRYHDRVALLVPGDTAASGPRCRDVSPTRAAEDPPGNKHGRSEAAAGGCRESQGTSDAQSQL